MEYICLCYWTLRGRICHQSASGIAISVTGWTRKNKNLQRPARVQAAFKCSLNLRQAKKAGRLGADAVNRVVAFMIRLMKSLVIVRSFVCVGSIEPTKSIYMYIYIYIYIECIYIYIYIYIYIRFIGSIMKIRIYSVCINNINI